MRVTFSNQTGFTLIEVTMAMVILGIGIMSIVALQARDMMYNNSSRRQTEAYTWAMDRVEQLRSESFLNVVSSPTPVTQGAYSISWTVKDDTDPLVLKDTKKISVTVRWNGKDISNIVFTKTDSAI